MLQLKWNCMQVSLNYFRLQLKLFHLDHGGLTEKEMEVFFLSDISIYFS